MIPNRPSIERCYEKIFMGPGNGPPIFFDAHRCPKSIYIHRVGSGEQKILMDGISFELQRG